MTARTYPLPLPETGDPRFTAALVDDVSRVLEQIHGLPPVAGRAGYCLHFVYLNRCDVLRDSVAAAHRVWLDELRGGVA